MAAIELSKRSISLYVVVSNKDSSNNPFLTRPLVFELKQAYILTTLTFITSSKYERRSYTPSLLKKNYL